MTDIFTKEQRKALMRKVKNKNTNIEIILRNALLAKGYRYRLRSKLIGKPDILFPSRKIAIFCDGDFWHGKNYDNERKNYKEFWVKKIEANITRDKFVNTSLKEQGWVVLRFWKTEILKDLDSCVAKIERYLKISENSQNTD